MSERWREPRPEARRARLHGERLFWFSETEDGRSSGASATGAGRVLVVDDEQPIRLVCRLNLQTAGFDTLEAGDGETALAVARSQRPDLILLDIMLPDVDGWSVAEQLMDAPETREILILFMTARSEVSDMVRGHGLGGIGYITKPFDPIDLTSTVASVIKRARRGERDAMRGEWERSLRRDG